MLEDGPRSDARNDMPVGQLVRTWVLDRQQQQAASNFHPFFASLFPRPAPHASGPRRNGRHVFSQTPRSSPGGASGSGQLLFTTDKAPDLLLPPPQRDRSRRFEMATAAAAFPGTAGGWRAACGVRRSAGAVPSSYGLGPPAGGDAAPDCRGRRVARGHPGGREGERLACQGLNLGNRRTGQIRTSTSKHKPKSGRGWKREGATFNPEQPQPELKFTDMPSPSLHMRLLDC